MKALIKKIETVNLVETILVDGEEVKKPMPYAKLSVYIPRESSGDLMHLVDQEVYLNENEPTGQGAMVISDELRNSLLRVFESGVSLLK